MIQLLATETDKYSVLMNFMYLPLGRKFSYIGDTKRRICCLVYIQIKLVILRKEDGEGFETTTGKKRIA